MSQLLKAQARATQYIAEANAARAEKKTLLPVLLLGNEAGEVEITFNTAGLEDVAASMVRLLAARLEATYTFIGGEAFIHAFNSANGETPTVPADYEYKEENMCLFLCIETRDENDFSAIVKPRGKTFPKKVAWDSFDRKRPAILTDGHLVDLIPPLDVVASCQTLVSLEALFAAGQNTGLYEKITIDEGMGTWMRKDEILRAAEPSPGAAN